MLAEGAAAAVAAVIVLIVLLIVVLIVVGYVCGVCVCKLIFTHLIELDCLSFFYPSYLTPSLFGLVAEGGPISLSGAPFFSSASYLF